MPAVRADDLTIGSSASARSCCGVTSATSAWADSSRTGLRRSFRSRTACSSSSRFCRLAAAAVPDFSDGLLFRGSRGADRRAGSRGETVVTASTITLCVCPDAVSVAANSRSSASAIFERGNAAAMPKFYRCVPVPSVASRARPVSNPTPGRSRRPAECRFDRSRTGDSAQPLQVRERWRSAAPAGHRSAPARPVGRSGTGD